MNLLEKILYYISHTDTEVIAKCTEHTQKYRKNLAWMAIVSGLITFYGVYHLAIITQQTLGNEGFVPLSVLQQAGSLLAALLITLASLAFYTNGMGLKQRLMQLPRLLFSIPLSILLTTAIVMDIAEDEITQKLHETVDKTNEKKAKRFTVNPVLTERESSLLKEIDSLNSSWKDNDKQMNKYEKLAGDELEGKGPSKKDGGEGTFYKNFKKQAKIMKQNRDHIATIITKKQNELKIIQDKIKQQRTQNEQKIAQASAAALKIQSAGFFTRLKLLPDILRQNILAKVFAIAISVAVMFLDLFPALMKLFAEKNEYDALLDVINEHKINIAYAYYNFHAPKVAKLDIEPDILHKLFEDFTRK